MYACHCCRLGQSGQSVALDIASGLCHLHKCDVGVQVIAPQTIAECFLQSYVGSTYVFSLIHLH